VDLRVAVPRRAERDACAVGRPRRQPVLALVLRQVVLRALKNVGDENIAAASAPERNVGNRSAIRRPRGHDVERTVHGESLLVLAVVVGEIDFLRRTLLNGAADALAVAIGVERNLRARDAAQPALLLVDLV